MNPVNSVLTNVFSKELIHNASAPRYAKTRFVDLVSATVLSKHFQRAIKNANALFGLDTAIEDKVIAKRFKKAAKTKKHAKKQHSKSAKEVTMSDTNTPKRKAGRPLGSKNKPKVAPVEPTIAESKPLVIEDIEEVEPQTDPDDIPLSEL
jgi:hypothetical protein